MSSVSLDSSDGGIRGGGEDIDILDDTLDPADSHSHSAHTTHKRRHSREYLYPGLQSRARQSTLRGAIFNLSATILGGGILSIPFCIKLCGLAFGSFFLLLIAAASNFSVYILVSCSRRIRHGASYEEVVASTFGAPLGRLVVFAMFILVYLCVVAYTILIRDLVTPLLELLFDTHFGPWGRFTIVAIVIILVMPLCLQKSIQALGWTSMVSVAAMLILGYCVVYRGMEQLLLSYSEPNHARFHDGGLKMMPDSWNDAIYAAPIFACSYTCHFNVLPLHRELIRPTRPRIKKMINWVIAFCSFLYLTIGIFGYIYARGFTDGNILNNFRVSDPLAVIGRVALAFCIISGLPMIVLPARQLGGKMLQILAPGLVAAMSVQPMHGDEESNQATPIVTAARSIHARSISDGATDPHAELLRQLAANRDFAECIDAHDPLEPAVDSDSEVEELFVSPQPNEESEAVQQKLSIDTTTTTVAAGASHEPKSGAALSTPRTVETASRSFGSGGSVATTESTPLMSSASPLAKRVSLTGTHYSTGTVTSAAAVVAAASLQQSSQIDPAFSSEQQPSDPNFTDRALTIQTIIICFTALCLSVRISSVATLWNLVGSSACIILGFIIPSACYLKIRKDKPLGLRMLAAWALLLLGVIGLIVCTMESLTTLATLNAAPKASTGVAPAATAAQSAGQT